MSVIELSFAKSYLRIAGAQQDALIQSLLDGAEDWVERRCGIKLATETVTEDLDGGEIYLFPSHRPVTAVTSVTDLHGNEEQDAVRIADRIARENEYGTPSGSVWDDGERRYRVVYTAGFGEIPYGLRMAILMLVSRAYENRGGAAADGQAGLSVQWAPLNSSDIEQLLRPYKRARVART